jgi:purine-binding chemotaxis protein CheW
MSKGPMGASEISKGPLDWSEIHRKLESIQQTIDDGWKLTQEENKQVLHERAEALSREPSQNELTGQSLEVVEFLLAQEHYGIELNYVREVYPLKDLTPLPGTPPFVLGVTNVRGQVISVIDIKKLFDLPDKGLTDLNKIIVVYTAEIELGILADAVFGLKSLPLSEIQPSLPTLKGIREDFLRGITRQSMVILDTKRLLTAQKAGWQGSV